MLNFLEQNVELSDLAETIELTGAAPTCLGAKLQHGQEMAAGNTVRHSMTPTARTDQAPTVPMPL